jgi:hypothetical protein
MRERQTRTISSSLCAGSVGGDGEEMLLLLLLAVLGPAADPDWDVEDRDGRECLPF